MGVLVFGGLAAALTIGAFVAKNRYDRYAYIFAAFFLAAMTAVAAIALWDSPWEWEGPAMGDAIAFAIVGFQLLHGIEDPEKPKKQFTNLVGANALAGVVLATVYAVWRIYHFATPVWMIWAAIIPMFIVWALVARGLKKLREGIEPFGPRRTL